jgi:hypothetical protein
MKERPVPFLETQGLNEFEKNLFEVLRKYLNGTKKGKEITDEEIVRRIKKVYNKDNDR